MARDQPRRSMCSSAPAIRTCCGAFRSAWSARSYSASCLTFSGHDGDLDGADWLGLAAGLAGLMCSGIGPVMVGVVGLAVLLRRGWRMAVFHTVPLAVIFLAWFVYRDDQPKTVGHVGLATLVSWVGRARTRCSTASVTTASSASRSPRC